MSRTYTKSFYSFEDDVLSEEINFWISDCYEEDDSFEVVDVKHGGNWKNSDDKLVETALIIYRTSAGCPLGEDL